MCLSLQAFALLVGLLATTTQAQDLCINEIPFYSSCIAGHVFDGCTTNCNIGEVPEDCDAFACWLGTQEGCCPECAEQLQSIVECRGCGNSTSCSNASFGPSQTGFAQCYNEFPFWVSCVGFYSTRGCADCEIELPNDCNGFQTFYNVNKDCCEQCNDQFNEVIQCSGCGQASVASSPSSPSFKSCVNEFPTYVSCIAANVRDGCPSNCATELPDNCAEFETFYNTNKDCCPDCANQLQRLVDCSECKPEGAPPTTSSGLFCRDAPTDLQECLSRNDDTDCSQTCAGVQVPMDDSCDAWKEWGCKINDCCDRCAGELGDALSCKVGDVDCEFDVVDCGRDQSGFGGCSESIASLGTCIARNCPNADFECDPGFEADNCEEAERACSLFSDCCNNDACQAELNAFLGTCAGDICTLECAAASSMAKETSSAGSTLPSCPVVVSAAAVAMKMIGA